MYVQILIYVYGWPDWPDWPGWARPDGLRVWLLAPKRAHQNPELREGISPSPPLPPPTPDPAPCLLLGTCASAPCILLGTCESAGGGQNGPNF